MYQKGRAPFVSTKLRSNKAKGRADSNRHRRIRACHQGQSASRSTNKNIWRPLWGPIKRGPTRSRARFPRRDEEYKARPVRIWREWQPHHTTTYGDCDCSPGGNGEIQNWAGETHGGGLSWAAARARPADGGNRRVSSKQRWVTQDQWELCRSLHPGRNLWNRGKALQGSHTSSYLRTLLPVHIVSACISTTISSSRVWSLTETAQNLFKYVLSDSLSLCLTLNRSHNRGGWPYFLRTAP